MNIFNISITEALNFLGLTIGWILAGFLLILEIFLLWFIWIGTTKKDWIWDNGNKKWHKTKGINLEYLISDEKGDASLSRFQFLIFTFVIAMSLFYIIVRANPPAFPNSIPWEILGLIGISGGSYVLAKSIDASKGTASGTESIQPPDSTGTVLGAIGSQVSTGSPLVQVVTNGSQVGIRSNTSTGTNGSQVDTVIIQAILKLGSSGPDVEKLQRRLQQLGFFDPGLINGNFGPETESAVKAFQAKNGIPVDGIVGPPTIDALGLSS